ncbi:hypothetical protein [Aquabacterium sp.]|nr:hypothetical protein [Aquabacterium sp.]
MSEVAKHVMSIVQSGGSASLLTLVALAAFGVVALALLVVRDAVNKKGQ